MYTFGSLLILVRHRKPGLTQARLVHQMGYDAALLARMIAGKKELTGPSGRSRVLQLLVVLCEEDVLGSLDEANSPLLSAGMHPLCALLAKDPTVFSKLTRSWEVA